LTYFTIIPFQRQIILYFAKCIVFADRNISITGIAVHGKYHEDSTVRFICTAELVGQFGSITAIWKLNNATINPTSNIYVFIFGMFRCLDEDAFLQDEHSIKVSLQI
jgi:hypothetical protein